MSRYDAVVIGAGHNGLVCATYLAKAGMKVLVLEQASVLGGCSTTEQVLPDHPEFRFNRGAIDLGHIQATPVLEELELERHGLKLIEHEPGWYFPFPDGSAISFYRDLDRTCESIAAVSEADAEAYRRFTALWSGMLDLMGPIDLGASPYVSRLAGLMGMTGRRGDEILHLLVSSPRELALKWFESPHMQGVMGWMGVQAGTPPDQPAAGLALTQLALTHRIGVARAEGGMGALCDSIRRALESHGGEVRLESGVDEVVLSSGRRSVTGVRVGSEQIDTDMVISSIDARRLFSDLIPERVLPASLHRRVTHIHTSGPSLFKLDVALSGVPVLPQPGGEAGITANINLSPSLEYLERAWNSYERDEVAEQPSVMCAVPSVLDRTLAPEGKHTLWLSQWNPADLWRRASADEVEACADTMLATFEKYAPGTTEMVIGRRATTPIEREAITGNRGGNPFHIDMTLDQSLSFRPVSGLHRFSTPVEGLYLSGSGTHPGGGVTGMPGFNTAHVVLASRRRRGMRSVVHLRERVTTVPGAASAFREIGKHL